MTHLRTLLVVLALAIGAPLAGAQDNPLLAAQAQGLVGERPDGLVGVVSSAAAAATRALVERINRERMAVYAQIARRNGTSVEAVQRSAGERLVKDTPAGQYYMDTNGRWQRR